MKQVKAYKGQRLDEIVYKEYGSLSQEIFNGVMAANSHLLRKTELDAGDIVYLPEIKIKEPKGKHLW